MSFVLDNSVAMCWPMASQPMWLTPRPCCAGCPARTAGAVPSQWALEAGNVIARGEAKGLLTEARSQAFVLLLGRLNIATDTATAAHALGAPLHLARRYKLSAYDAAYLELALRTGSPLATLDAGLKKAARSAGVKPFAPN